MRKMLLIFMAALMTFLSSGCSYNDNNDDDDVVDKKPVIYLYPERELEAEVKIDLKGRLTCTYPKYNDGWRVMAKPTGELKNSDDGREYSYLYWEGVSDVEYDMTKGYVIEGEATAKFLQEKLSEMGLTPKEYNEFIVYWLPQMENNKYNLITFQEEAYTDSARLTITPKPDSVLRVFMVFKPLDEKLIVEEPTIKHFERKGFTVVEWGGAEVR